MMRASYFRDIKTCKNERNKRIVKEIEVAIKRHNADKNDNEISRETLDAKECIFMYS